MQLKPERPARLALHGISKRYPAVVANDRISLRVAPGEIHALLGENGAGKSTLMKIVYGVTQPDAGHIEWEGRPVRIDNPAAARDLGIGMVFQHFSLFETLTVSQNIQLAIEPRQPRALAQQIREVSETYGLPIDPERLVHSMSVGERQRVEIVRCLLQSPQLLIMDEPTSVLTPQAVRMLFDTLRRLARENVSILYISHKLDEVRELCDSATVLRAGRVSGAAIPRNETNESLARMMVGADVPECRLVPQPAGEPRLELRDLCLTSNDPFGTTLQSIDLSVRAGEIVGIAGVSGNGQRELLAAISGEILGARSGAIRICGQDAGALLPAPRRRLGLSFVPEERLGRGAVPEMSLADNALLTAHASGLVDHGIVHMPAAREFARTTINEFDVKASSELATASSLSGGNLQKFIVGREVRLAPKIMVIAQPTWGVDVGASQRIRQALIGLRDTGAAVLVVSEDLDELYAICDRLAVLSRGRLSPISPTVDMPVEKVGLWMAGEFMGGQAHG
ncbi:MAG TPA: ABC transporter ATP-binding protein [Povalibacter sp.]